MPPFIIILNVPSASTSFIMSWSSASVGFWPSDRMTVPNSLVVIVPSPSLSNNEKASLNSAICSSVNWSAWKLEIDIGYLYQFWRGIVIVIKFIKLRKFYLSQYFRTLTQLESLLIHCRYCNFISVCTCSFRPYPIWIDLFELFFNLKHTFIPTSFLKTSFLCGGC